MPVRTRITEKGVIQEDISPDDSSPESTFSIEIPGSYLGSSLSGGGGATVVADGGTVSGTYQGTVVCEGDVTVTGTLEVVGDMIVRGDFINSGGHDVTVRGDLFAQLIDFDRDDTTIPQSNFSVDGDLIFTGMNFLQTGGSAAQLRVGGDLIGATGVNGTVLNGSGDYEGTPGLNILVYGDMVVYEVYLNGATGTTGTAGAGGTVDVYGSLYFDRFEAMGGNGTNQNAGGGGGLESHGSIEAGYGYAYLNGGNSTGGSGGNGGYISVAGDMTVNEIEVYGGDCTSDSELHRSGNGGSVYIDGDLIVNDYINVNGGDRYGTLSVGGSESPPSGGYLSVEGDLKIYDGDFSGHGGDVNTTGFSPHSGGHGANIDVRGNITAGDDFRATGGHASVGNGGNGGTLNVDGSVFINDELEFYGGYSNSGNAGNGGTVYINGLAQLAYVDLSGASAVDGNGGQGGSLNCDGMLILDDSCYLSGGDCTSDDHNRIAGSGGPLTCDGLVSPWVTITSHGGLRVGNTSVSSTGNSRADGGDFNCYGDARFYGLELVGGSVVTTYPNSAGGHGGEVNVVGNLVCDGINSSGGDAVGNSGGAGGAVYIDGNSVFGYIYVDGGDSSNSSGVGSDATMNGYGGSVYLRGGAVGGTLAMRDGDGVGSAPPTSVRLAIRGNCHFNQVNMVNKSGAWIYSDSAMGATLRINSMGDKSTLNNLSGVATGDISSNLSDSIFTANGSSTWYTITGTAT